MNASAEEAHALHRRRDWRRGIGPTAVAPPAAVGVDSINPSLQCLVGCIQPIIRHIDFACTLATTATVEVFLTDRCQPLRPPVHCQRSTHWGSGLHRATDFCEWLKAPATSRLQPGVNPSRPLPGSHGISVSRHDLDRSALRRARHRAVMSRVGITSARSAREYPLGV
jgi:hypothetical protein